MATHAKRLTTEARAASGFGPSGWPAAWVLSCAALLLFARKPDAIVHPQFWAEDYNPFFTDADAVGAASLFRPYAGYLHLIPRLIAYFGSFLDPALGPSVYVACAAAGALFVVGLVISPRLRWPGAPWIALIVVLVPHTGEVFLNPTNLQWIGALGLLITSFKDDPKTIGDWTVDLTALLGFGLTGIFSILFAPLFLVRALRRRRSSSWCLLAFVGLTAAVQFSVWLHTHASVYHPDHGPWNGLRLIQEVSLRVPATLLLNPVWGARAGVAATVLSVAGCGVFLWFILHRDRGLGVRLQLLAAFLVVLVAGAVRSRPDSWDVGDIIDGDRYFYLPKVLALWLMVLAAFSRGGGAGRGWGTAALVWILIINFQQFRIPPQPNLHWENYCPMIRAGLPVTILTNPGWKSEYPGRRKAAAD